MLLDLGLPDLDGREVCRRLREVSATPIIVVTARGDAFDRVLLLELGADDYVVKPFGFRELVARIRAVLRRAAPETPSRKEPARTADVAARGALRVDRRARRVSVAGREVVLTATAALGRRAGLRHEDLDLVVGRRGPDGDLGLHEFRVALDGVMSRHSDVVTLATTNDPATLDPAAVRAARFDRLAEVTLPDDVHRAAILVRYLGPLGARSTPGPWPPPPRGRPAPTCELVRRSVPACGSDSTPRSCCASRARAAGREGDGALPVTTRPGLQAGWSPPEVSGRHSASFATAWAQRKYLLVPRSATVLMLNASLRSLASPSLTPFRASTEAAARSAMLLPA